MSKNSITLYDEAQEKNLAFFVNKEVTVSAQTVANITKLDLEIILQTEEETVLNKQLTLIRYQKGEKIAQLKESIPKDFWKDWLAWKLFEVVSYKTLGKEELKILESKSNQLKNYEKLYFAINAAIVYRNNSCGDDNLTVERFIDEYDEIPTQIWYALGRNSIKGNSALYGLIFDYMEMGEKITLPILNKAKKVLVMDLEEPVKKVILDHLFAGNEVDLENPVNSINPVTNSIKQIEVEVIANEKYSDNEEEIVKTILPVRPTQINPAKQAQDALSTSAASVFAVNTPLISSTEQDNKTPDPDKEDVTSTESLRFDKDSEIKALTDALGKAIQKSRKLGEEIEELKFQNETLAEDLRQANIDLFAANERIKILELTNESPNIKEKNSFSDEEKDEVLDTAFNIEDELEKYQQLMKYVESNITSSARILSICNHLNLKTSKFLTPAAIRSKLKNHLLALMTNLED